MKKLILFFILLFMLSLEANAIGKQIQQYEIVEQKCGTVLTASIGDTILKIILKSDLPNAFGKADIIGGKVDKGYKTISFLGLNKDGTIKLKIVNVSIMTNETTMSRYGSDTTYVNLNSNSNLNQFYNLATGNTSTTGTIRHVNKQAINRDVLPQNIVELDFDYKKNDELNFGNKKIKILKVDDFNIQYIVY